MSPAKVDTYNKTKRANNFSTKVNIISIDVYISYSSLSLSILHNTYNKTKRANNFPTKQKIIKLIYLYKSTVECEILCILHDNQH